MPLRNRRPDLLRPAGRAASGSACALALLLLLLRPVFGLTGMRQCRVILCSFLNTR